MIILFIMVNSNNPIYKDFKIIEESKKIISDLILNGSKNVTPPFQRGQGGFI